MGGAGPTLWNLVSEPTYALPLWSTLALFLGLAWWSRNRRAEFAGPTNLGVHSGRAIPAEAIAYDRLEKGRYLATVDLLGVRLGRVLADRYSVRIDQLRHLHAIDPAPKLPPPLTLDGVLRSLQRAYNSAWVAESEPGDLFSFAWVEERHRRTAARDFENAVAALEVALPILEAG